jgi:hypothetical protein
MKICVANGLVLLDYKTSNGVYSDMLIQLAAYKNLWEENRPDLPITGGCHLLRFAKERGDFAHHYFQELDDEWEQFLLFRQAYDSTRPSRSGLHSAERRNLERARKLAHVRQLIIVCVRPARARVVYFIRITRGFCAILMLCRLRSCRH